MIGGIAEVEDGSEIAADLCIIGAGAAGISIALQFLDSDLSVLLIEAGGLGPDPATQSLYAGEVTDPALHSPPETYRERRFGGSTTIWGGRCMPFDPIDFTRRPAIPHSGWPIGYDALAPYYPLANELCEAGEFAYRASDAFPGGMRPLIPSFAGAHFTDDTLERFSCPTDFGRRYRERLRASRSVRVLLGANLTEIVPDAARRSVAALELQSLGGRRVSVRPRLVVLAAGGLETARLLLAARGFHPAGIGNAHDQLGRYYMCHIAGTIGALRLDAPRQAIWHGYEMSADGIYCRRRLALRPEVQQSEGLGNFVARLHHPRIPDPEHRTGALSAIYLARHFIRYEYGRRLAAEGAGTGRRDGLRHLRNLVGDPAETARFLLHWLWRRSLAERKFPSVVIRPRANLFSIDFHAEQVPNPESRVRLGQQTDRFGMPRLLIDWRHSAADIRTVRRSLRLLAVDIAAGGHGRLDYDPEMVAAAALRDGAYGGHHIGTARMADSPREGVVDADCRVHGTDNLYLASSAVFPTASQANPTLTIVALALRLAAHLRPLARKRGMAAAMSGVATRVPVAADRAEVMPVAPPPSAVTARAASPSSAAAVPQARAPA